MPNKPITRSLLRVLRTGTICVLVLTGDSVRRDSGENPSKSRASLIGTWRAVEYVRPDAQDEDIRHPLGRDPRGYLVYDATGHVFFQVVSGLAAVHDVRGRWRQADSANLLSLLEGSASYFGAYKPDYDRGVVVHTIEGEIPPNLGVTEIATPFRLHADTLRLGRDSSAHWLFLRVH